MQCAGTEATHARHTRAFVSVNDFLFRSAVAGCDDLLVRQTILPGRGLGQQPVGLPPILPQIEVLLGDEPAVRGPLHRDGIDFDIRATKRGVDRKFICCEYVV
jgi:hypothetical protein